MISLISTMLLMGATFMLGFYINIYLGLFLCIWMTVSINWFIIALGDKYPPDNWYDRPLGFPVAAMVYIWSELDKIERRNAKN